MKFPTLLEYLTGQRDKLGVLMLAPMLNKLIAAFTMLGLKFYSQPLALWMFVPCGEDGKPLKFPIRADYDDHDLGVSLYSIKHSEFEAAQRCVLFEGWEVEKEESLYIVRHKALCVRFNDLGGIIDMVVLPYAFTHASTLNDLVELSVIYQIDLTPTQSSKDQLNIKE